MPNFDRVVNKFRHSFRKSRDLDASPVEHEEPASAPQPFYTDLPMFKANGTWETNNYESSIVSSEPSLYLGKAQTSDLPAIAIDASAIGSEPSAFAPKDRNISVAKTEPDLQKIASAIATKQPEPRDPQSDYRSKPRCPSCGIDTVLAESRFHRSQTLAYRGAESLLFEHCMTGSLSGCNFCSLLLEAVLAWSVQQSLDYSLATITYVINDEDEERTVRVELSIEKDPAAYSFSMYATEGIDTRWDLRKFPKLSTDTSSAQAVSTLRQWIDICRTEHEHCKGNARSLLTPKRILKLTDERVQLLEGTHSLPDYACLSHCWGPVGPSLTLKSTTAALLQNGLSLSELPRTFREAAKLCQDLDIRYLWIDALCILQDSEEDWHSNAASMAAIYAGATLTIAATSSNDSNNGCFSHTRPSFKPIYLPRSKLCVQIHRGIGLGFPQTALNIGENDLNWPLLQRAWVFQERKLSARVVHLAQDQLYWECNTAFLSEDGHEDIRNYQALNLRAQHKDPVVAWRHTVEHYSRLDLTFEEDRLPAISAIVKQMQSSRTSDVYIAGMWLHSLLSDLTWGASRPVSYRRHPTIPSWSWVSTSAGTAWSSTEPISAAKLIDADYKIMGPAHFGHAPDASITIEGPCVTGLTIEAIKASGWVTRLLIPGMDPYQINSELSPDFILETISPPILPGDSLDVLLLCSMSNEVGNRTERTGLLLRRNTNGLSERLGFVRIYCAASRESKDHALEKFMDSLPIRQFTIV